MRSRASATSCRCVGIDVVEVSPPYDHAEITAFLGNRVVLEALSGIARRRKDGGQVLWDRATPLLEGRGTQRLPLGASSNDSVEALTCSYRSG